MWCATNKVRGSLQVNRSVLRGNNKFSASAHHLRSFLRATQFVQRFALGSVRFLAAVVGKSFGHAVSLGTARAHNNYKQRDSQTLRVCLPLL